MTTTAPTLPGPQQADMRIKDLEEENKLLLEQLHVVQEELERLHHEGSGLGHKKTGGVEHLHWVDDRLPEVMAENMRWRAVVQTQKEIHQLQAQRTLSSKLGDMLIQAASSPVALMAAPAKLLKVWQKEKKQTPPGELGGAGFDKVIAAYRSQGISAVESLLAPTSLSDTLQANAWTALARSLVHHNPSAAAEMARRAYALEPRPFRLKWLAFRLHEAGEWLEAEAMLDSLPPDLPFSDSEARQARRLRSEAQQARLREAKQKCGYSENRAEVERQLMALSQARDEQATLAAQWQGELQALQQTQSQLEQENAALLAQSQALQRELSALNQARDEQAILAAQWQGELLQLTREKVEIEKQKLAQDYRIRELERQLEQEVRASQEQSKLAVQSIQEMAVSLEQRNGAIDELFKKQANDLISVRKYLDSSLKKEVANATKQIEASIGLQSYFATGELPNVNTEHHSWPVSPDFALYLIELIELNDYDLIIEFGSGISTVIVAKTLAKMAPRRQGKPPVDFVSFDHLDEYYRQTRAQLQHAGLVDAVQLTLAPLKVWQASDGASQPYYTCLPTLEALAKKHPAAGLHLLVIVDGPPAATGKHARYPAGPLILQHFTGAQIDLLLDDYVRDDEKEIAQRWQTDIAAANLSQTTIERKLEKDACLIKVQGANSK